MNKEEEILKAAETEFLEKGFAASRTVEIARRAGVTHAMLHYYFQTKENLFNRVLSQKVASFALVLTSTIKDDAPLLEVVVDFVSKHFELMSQNPNLPRFMINEVMSSEEGSRMCKEIIAPRFKMFMEKMGKILQREVAAGNIRYISVPDFFFNVVAINAMTFVARPIILIMFNGDEVATDLFIQHRKQENVELILSRIRPS